MDGSALGSSSGLVIENFNRGLRSRLLSEQLATVASTVALLETHSFPQLVNTIIVRLIDVFHDGSNSIRAAISRVLGECRSKLRFVFSVHVVLRRLLNLSHSNDPKARALMLAALSNLAPIAADNKQAQHVVLEALNSAHDCEFEGACSAVGAFALECIEFSSTVLNELSGHLCSSATSVERKTQLVSLIGGMRANQETIDAIFEVGASLLETNTNPTFVCTLLSSLTHLAARTRFVIPRQLSLLLSVISSAAISPSLALLALRQLALLARHPHLWNQDHVKCLADYRVVCSEREETACAWLSALAVLSRQPLLEQIPYLTGALSQLSSLYGEASLNERVCFLDFSVNLFLLSGDSLHRDSLLNSIVSTLALSHSPSNARRLCRVAGRFLCSREVDDKLATEAVQSICAVRGASEGAGGTGELLELFCLLAHSRECLAGPLSEWSAARLSSGSSTQLPLAVLLLCRPGRDLPLSTSSLSSLHFRSDLERYDAARAAFRTGHWKDIALPLLQQCSDQSLSWQCRGWLCALRGLAGSQPSTFSVSDMQESSHHLRLAKDLLERVNGGPSPHPPPFPARFVRALLTSREAELQLLSSLSTFTSLGPCLSRLNASRMVHDATEAAARGLGAAEEEWAELGRRCLDADEESLSALYMMQAAVSALRHALLCLGQPSPPPPMNVPCVSGGATSTMERSVVVWAAASAQNLAGRGEEVTEEMLAHLLNIMKTLYLRPLFLPRFFFQQMRNTNIQLTVSPGVDGEVSVRSGQPIPLRVDGVISGRDAVSCESIIISTRIHFYNASGKDYKEKRTVETEKGSFFSAQFLFTFNESAQVDFTVEVVDSIRRKCWLSDATATLRVDLSH